MNTALKVTAGFVIGAAIGSLVTYFVVRDGFQASADEQIVNMREYYIQHPPVKKEPKSEKKPAGNISDHSLESFGKEPKNYEEMAQKYITRYRNPDMDELMSRVEETVDEEGKTIEVDIPQKDRRETPYLIPEGSYMTLGIFNHDAVEYWVQDNILTVADTDEVLDIPSTIGLDAINALLDPQRDSDVVFVRNEKLGIEYEVERKEGSYAAWIGEDTGNTQPVQRRFRNKYEDDDD